MVIHVNHVNPVIKLMLLIEYACVLSQFAQVTQSILKTDIPVLHARVENIQMLHILTVNVVRQPVVEIKFNQVMDAPAHLVVKTLSQMP
jgi:hypothetical protein